MKNEPELKDSSGKHPHDRFTDLGRKLLTVPKSEVDKREADWRKRKRRVAGPRKRG